MARSVAFRPERMRSGCIVHPPAYLLSELLKRTLTPRVYAQLVKPRLVDMYDQYYPLIASGQERMARWVTYRGSLLLLWSLIEAPLRSLLDLFRR